MPVKSLSMKSMKVQKKGKTGKPAASSMKVALAMKKALKHQSESEDDESESKNDDSSHKQDQIVRVYLKSFRFDVSVSISVSMYNIYYSKVMLCI